MKPSAATTTPSRPCCTELTKTFFTRDTSSAIASTKNTRSAFDDSRKLPGETCETSSREASCSRNSPLFCSAQGERNSDSSATTKTIGSAKRNTGEIQAVSGSPEENHTIISESR